MSTLKLGVGTMVYFGRRDGEKFLGQVMKLNQKTASVRTIWQRGRDYVYGQQRRVPYANLSAVSKD